GGCTGAGMWRVSRGRAARASAALLQQRFEDAAGLRGVAAGHADERHVDAERAALVELLGAALERAHDRGLVEHAVGDGGRRGLRVARFPGGADLRDLLLEAVADQHLVVEGAHAADVEGDWRARLHADLLIAAGVRDLHDGRGGDGDVGARFAALAGALHHGLDALLDLVLRPVDRDPAVGDLARLHHALRRDRGDVRRDVLAKRRELHREAT